MVLHSQIYMKKIFLVFLTSTIFISGVTARYHSSNQFFGKTTIEHGSEIHRPERNQHLSSFRKIDIDAISTQIISSVSSPIFRLTVATLSINQLFLKIARAMERKRNKKTIHNLKEPTHSRNDLSDTKSVAMVYVRIHVDLVGNNATKDTFKFAC